jgi:hypothetical protein
MIARVIRIATATVAATASIAALAIAPATADTKASLAAVRQATDQFHDMTLLPPAGYEHFLDCFDSPSGGMGQHFADLSRVDGDLDALRPEVLVYEPRPDGYRLVAVEYVVPGNLPQPDGLFPGSEFTMEPNLGVWKLHAWIWRGNPDGVFADFNPNVRACP